MNQGKYDNFHFKLYIEVSNPNKIEMWLLKREECGGNISIIIRFQQEGHILSHVN